MKIRVLSDIHLEVDPTPIDTVIKNKESYQLDFVPCDVVVLAGDTAPGTRGIEWAKEQFYGIPVIYVLGNHEFYHNKFPLTIEECKDAAKGSNVHVLEMDSVEIDGVKFFGCSLWTDFDLYGNRSEGRWEASRGLNDYKKIKYNPTWRKLQTGDTEARHYISRNWLREQDLKDSVVVTHHAPSRLGLNAGGCKELDPAYASNMDEFVAASGARYWIHGHTHIARRYRIGETSVVVNCRGYEAYHGPALGFDPNYVIEI